MYTYMYMYIIIMQSFAHILIYNKIKTVSSSRIEVVLQWYWPLLSIHHMTRLQCIYRKTVIIIIHVNIFLKDGYFDNNYF